MRDLAVGAESGSSVAGTVRLLASHQLEPTRPLHVVVGGLLDLNGFDQLFESVTMQGGRVVTGSGTLTVTQWVSTSIVMLEAATIEGNLNLGGGIVDFLVGDLLPPGETEIVVSGVIPDGGIRQDAAPAVTAPGRLDLRGANLYTGTTTVDAGTLAINGSIASPTTIAPGARLEGAGTIAGPIAAVGGTIAPGNCPGVLHSGSVALDSASTFVVEIAGTAVAAQYDQLDVTGTVALGGATLSIALGFAPQGGTAFVLIRNDGTDPVAGIFAGLPEGAALVVGGTSFTISYRGGDGNDVVVAAKSDQVISFSNPGPLQLGVGTVGLVATSTSGLVVTAMSNSTGICTASGLSVTLLTPGVCALTLSQPGSAAYNPAVPVDASFAVVGAGIDSHAGRPGTGHARPAARRARLGAATVPGARMPVSRDELAHRPGSQTPHDWYGICITLVTRGAEARSESPSSAPPI